MLSPAVPLDFANFYPRPPRGGRPSASQISYAGWQFLSTPSARRATFVRQMSWHDAKFLSTPSARRATPCAVHLRCMRQISIHALREEGDVAGIVHLRVLNRFLSTPSARRATCRRCRVYRWMAFLSTPSARRATFQTKRTGWGKEYFYPRPPRGGRPL